MRLNLRLLIRFSLLSNHIDQYHHYGVWRPTLAVAALPIRQPITCKLCIYHRTWSSFILSLFNSLSALVVDRCLRSASQSWRSDGVLGENVQIINGQCTFAYLDLPSGMICDRLYVHRRLLWDSSRLDYKESIILFGLWDMTRRSRDCLCCKSVVLQMLWLLFSF